MGNCFESLVVKSDSHSNNINTASSSSAGTYNKNDDDYGHTMEISATTSSSRADNNKCIFSEAMISDDDDHGVEEEASPNGQILATPYLKVFSFVDLKSATRNFNPHTWLGQGGFGEVYKGWVDEKTLAPSNNSELGIGVAVKRLNPESMQGFDEWQSEVNFLGTLSHPNLVKLLGYCWEDKELLLVYEFMKKGSLENHLFRRNSSIQALSWDIRLKIAIGAARGLAFLHTSEKKVIYRDFKASNILLDGNYNAKISDFGLAKLGPAGADSHVTTRVMGTEGYAAPEYVATGHLYVKSDVYGFGVVLLELLTGLRALDPKRPSGRENLAEWLKPLLSSQKKKLKAIMDARIKGQYSSKAASRVAELTLRCLESDHKHRPSMQEVLEVLEQVEAMTEKPKKSMFSRTTSHFAPPHQPILHLQDTIRNLFIEWSGWSIHFYVRVH